MREEAPTIVAEEPSRDNVSLYVAIAVMTALAVTSVLITFSLFLRSDAYKTVQKIQANEKLDGSALSDYDTTSPVKPADIEETVKGIQNKIEGLDNNADYGNDGVSDSTLGISR